MSVQTNRGFLATLVKVCENSSVASLESVWNAYPDIQALLQAYMHGVANPMGDSRTQARIERVTHLLRTMGGGAVSPQRADMNLFSDVM